jgi:hypothetical protein
MATLVAVLALVPYSTAGLRRSGRDPRQPERDAVHEFHWLSTRHGALLKTLPVHDPNDLYDTTFRLFTLQSPFRMGKTQHAIDLLSDERFVNLGANLRYFRGKYDAILARHDERRDMR